MDLSVNIREIIDEHGISILEENPMNFYELLRNYSSDYTYEMQLIYQMCQQNIMEYVVSTYRATPYEREEKLYELWNQLIIVCNFTDADAYTSILCFSTAFGWEFNIQMPDSDSPRIASETDFQLKSKANSYVICKYLGNQSEIIIPETIRGRKVIEIGNNAFANNQILRKITIPNSVTKIGHKAFQKCSNLETVIAHNAIKFIGNYAFQGCTAIQTMDFGEGIPGEKRVAFPNRQVRIGAHAFSKNTFMKRSKVPVIKEATIAKLTKSSSRYNAFDKDVLLFFHKETPISTFLRILRIIAIIYLILCIIVIPLFFIL